MWVSEFVAFICSYASPILLMEQVPADFIVIKKKSNYF